MLTKLLYHLSYDDILYKLNHAYQKQLQIYGITNMFMKDYSRFPSREADKECDDMVRYLDALGRYEEHRRDVD